MVSPVAPVRDKLVTQGITINGLPILINPSGVPGGQASPVSTTITTTASSAVPASFVIPIKTLADFAPAIRRKLILEIAASVLPRLPVVPIVPVVDTLNAPRSTASWPKRSTLRIPP